MPAAELVLVRTFNIQLEADVAKSALDAARIDAIIQADTPGGMLLDPASSGAGFRVLVSDGIVAAARQVLRPGQHGKRK
jgi:hypothetical protein